MASWAVLNARNNDCLRPSPSPDRFQARLIRKRGTGAPDGKSSVMSKRLQSMSSRGAPCLVSVVNIQAKSFRASIDVEESDVLTPAAKPMVICFDGGGPAGFGIAILCISRVRRTLFTEKGWMVTSSWMCFCIMEQWVGVWYAGDHIALVSVRSLCYMAF